MRLFKYQEEIRTRVAPRRGQEALRPCNFAGTAKVFGRVRARLEQAEEILPDADLQIAATAMRHGLELVTGNVRHFVRIRGLKINRVLADSRGRE